MPNHENFLSEETSLMTRGVGGWVNEDNATVSHKVRFSPYTETIGSDVMTNSMKVTAKTSADMTVVTERFSVTPGEAHKGYLWVYGAGIPDTSCGLRYYSVDGTLLQESFTKFTNLTNDTWVGVFAITEAPENTVSAELAVLFESATIGQEVYVAWPSVMQQSKITTNFVDYALYNIPDYVLETDLAQRGIYAPTPMVRYTVVAAKQLSDAMDTIVSWDHVPAAFSLTGETDYSSLTSPAKAEAEWLPWLAQLMGVSLDTIPSGGRSPWVSFEGQGIDTWTEWEEDIDPRSVPGIPDTEWVDIETYSPDYYSTEAARRLQIASGFNGVLGGTSESIIRYVTALLNTDEEDPFVYVVKHYATNPYRIAVAVLKGEDPDPRGDMLAVAIESAAPAGTSVEVKHGVSVTANTFFSVPDVFHNMWTDIESGGSTLPTWFVENSSANGRHITTNSVTGSAMPFLGGGLALARWFPGLALYSGAVEANVSSLGAYNIVGDIDIRVLVSNFRIPAGNREIASSPNKWKLSIDSQGRLVFEWENAGTNEVTSKIIDWGSEEKGPFWIRVTLDVNNDAGGYTVEFSTAPTLYEDEWDVNYSVATSSGVSGIDSVSASLTLLGNNTATEDGATGMIYRFLMLDGIDGNIAADINLISDAAIEDLSINTGASSFTLPVTNSLVQIVPSTGPNLNESVWTAQNKTGNDYFYFGRSPRAFSGSNPTSLGDTIAVSGLASNSFDWTINKADGTTATGSTGATTSITWNADSYGGASIASIVVKTTAGQTTVAHFTPDLFEGMTVSAADTYSADWDLTRSFETTYLYEYSAYVDRSYITPTEDGGVFDSGLTFDAEETFTVAAAVRRFWDTNAVIVDIVDHTTGSGWTLRYNGIKTQALITDGTTILKLDYEPVPDPLLGEFMLVTLRRDVSEGTISLWINDTMADSAPDPFLDGGLFPVTGRTGIVGSDTAENKFDLRYLGVFDRALTGAEIGFLSEEVALLSDVLPPGDQAVITPTFTSLVTVFSPGVVSEYIEPALLDASPTLYEPTTQIYIHAPYVPPAGTVYKPEVGIVT